MILVLNDSVVDDIDVLVLKVLGVYAVCGVKSLMMVSLSSIISSTFFFFAALAATTFDARMTHKVVFIEFYHSYQWVTAKIPKRLFTQTQTQLFGFPHFLKRRQKFTQAPIY